MRWTNGLLVVIAPLALCLGCVSQGGGGQAAGWTDAQRNAWYVADQGSRLIPQKWIDALEQPADAAPVGNGKFIDPAYLAQFKYLLPTDYKRRDADPSCPIDPNLPIGFVTDCQNSAKFGVSNLQWLSKPHPTEPWVGMNCSACHTNQVELRFTDGKPDATQTVIVDGAPTLADFQGFMAALEKALQQTLKDEQRFARFAAAVLPAAEAQTARQDLKAAVAKLVAWNENLARLNADQSVSYGYGRLDAVGHIFNKVAAVGLPTADQTSNPSDAPVSYPFLWNVTQLDRVEWNAIAPNIPIKVIGTEDAGALIRNTTEVIGVFADLTITPNPGAHGYVTSARLDRLDEIEQQLRSLKPPVWPARFGLNQETDKSKPAYARSVARGQELFGPACARCHTVPKAGNPASERFTTALTPLDDVQTDIWMACNASFDQAKAGAFKDTPQNLVEGVPLKDPATNLSMAQAATVGTLLGRKGELLESVVKGLLGLNKGLPEAKPPVGLAAVNPKDLRRNQCLNAMRTKTDPHNPQLVYKGRPLQGIWATAPYLHNGSAPTLYALLQAPKDRPTTFCVGSRVFDPVNVGFDSKGPCAGPAQFNTTLDGNSNLGHNYGNAALSDDDRYALIEYMKTL